MEEIPFASNQDFPYHKIGSFVSGDPAAVRSGKSVYQNLKKQGLVKLFIKEKYKNVKEEALPSIAEGLKILKNSDLKSVQMLFEALKSPIYMTSNNVIEEIENSSDGTTFFYCSISVNEETERFNIAICCIQVERAITGAEMAAGLMTEGILGKDEKDRLYLQF